MFRRSLFATGIVVVALLALTVPALAKMGVTGVDIPPDTTAGQPFEVTFTMEDHDGGLSEDSQMVVLARNSSTGETLEFAATPKGDKFHWTAQLTLPTDGSWVLTVEEPKLGFRQNLRSIAVAANPSLGVTRAELDSTIADATAPLTQQISGMTLEIDQLRKQLGTLTAERDVLQKQIADLRSAPVPAAAESSVDWWLAALVGAVAAAIVMAAGFTFATRRGLLTQPERRELAPVATGVGD
jgi:hypothetical protein